MTTAFVLGGGGILGDAEVGQALALSEAGIRPDVICGTSIGAINGAYLAMDPSPEGTERLADLWMRLTDDAVFGGSLRERLAHLARTRTALHDPRRLRDLIADPLPDSFEELAVPFHCVAACVETASAQWFSTGELVTPVLASCAVPGLFPTVVIDGLHYMDGGLVHSIPLGRAVALGATTIYVLQVGRMEQPLTPPATPLGVGVVAFEIARRHRFVEELARAREGVEVHVLPAGPDASPSPNEARKQLAYRSDGTASTDRIEAARWATEAYLATQ